MTEALFCRFNSLFWPAGRTDDQPNEMRKKVKFFTLSIRFDCLSICRRHNCKTTDINNWLTRFDPKFPIAAALFLARASARKQEALLFVTAVSPLRPKLEQKSDVATALPACRNCTPSSMAEIDRF